jgi:hypothetical protein
MAKRTNRVVLQAGDVKQEFEVNHAERILRMPDNGGWHLPDDSNFSLDKVNGLTSKRNKGADKKPEENADNS